MHSVSAFTVFGVDWEFLKPYIVLGLALGGVYALSGVGIVVLYQATGVLNLAFGAIGAAGALIAYYLVNHTSWPALARLSRLRRCSAGSSTSSTAWCSAPPSRARDPLVKMMGTLGARADPARRDGLARAGRRRVRARSSAADARPPLRALRRGRELDADDRARVRARAHRRRRRPSCASRSSAPRCGRSPTTARSPPRSACPVRRVEASAWLGSGLVCGAAGLLLADLLTSLDYAALTFLVISSLAAALIGRLRSLWVDARGRPRGRPRPGGRSRRTRRSRATAGGAVRARDRRAALALAAPRRHDLADGRVAPCVARPRERRLARSTRGASIGHVSARSIVAFLVVVLFVLPPSSAPTGSRPSRASRSTRSSPPGSGSLYGRVGMISLGQIALLAIGIWIGDAARVRDGAPVPGPAARHRRDHLRGRRAGRACRRCASPASTSR